MKKVILFVIALASVSALSGCVWPFWSPGGDGPGHMGPGGGGGPGGGPHR
ncbi:MULTISPECIES: hypothetical protein [Pantoea]|nr:MULTISPECIES: hypothetical protein [Pantoea]